MPADAYAARRVDNLFLDGVKPLAVVEVEFLVGPALPQRWRSKWANRRATVQWRAGQWRQVLNRATGGQRQKRQQRSAFEDVHVSH